MGRGARAEQALGLDGVESAVAPRVAAQDPPPGQDDSTQYAVALDGLDGVGRARGLVLAARRQRRRDEGAPQRDRQHGQAAGQAHSAISSASARLIPASPSREASSRASGRATSTKSWLAGRLSATAQNASRSSRFTRFRSTAPPTLRETDTPNRGSRASAPRGNE